MYPGDDPQVETPLNRMLTIGGATDPVIEIFFRNVNVVRLRIIGDTDPNFLLKSVVFYGISIKLVKRGDGDMLLH